MSGEIDLGGVVEDQDQGSSGHGLPRLLPVGRLEGGQGGVLLIAEAVEVREIVPVEELVEGGFGMSGDLGSGGDESSGASLIAEIDGTESF